LTGIFAEENIVGVTETFAALAEPNRFRIVELLRAGARSVNEIGERLDIKQSQVSKHLRVLKEARLVDVEARAQQRLYGLRAEPLRELNDWLSRYRDLWDERFRVLDGLLTELEQKKERVHGRRHPTKRK
jgi:DNA-binding transcriptional ArsR family regulator